MNDNATGTIEKERPPHRKTSFKQPLTANDLQLKALRYLIKEDERPSPDQKMELRRLVHSDFLPPFEEAIKEYFRQPYNKAIAAPKDVLEKLEVMKAIRKPKVNTSEANIRRLAVTAAGDYLKHVALHPPGVLRRQGAHEELESFIADKNVEPYTPSR